MDPVGEVEIVRNCRSCFSATCRYEDGVMPVMSKLRVKCLNCGKEWEKDSLISWTSDDISSSLCRSCFLQVVSPIIHRKQRNEGNFDCFGKASTYCDQPECKYRRWCLRMEREDR